ncbi:MAG TPA: serine/threonine-protein kinase [Amycolatopsis sp.]|nr:serine/threonine-protein kinase [Amycolatopsis sp.]HKS46658.1 serine/threonine-protein kinase [Amycolatopsis sp.]
MAGFTELRPLGEGGFGRVVLARHDASGTPVAVKYLFKRYLTDPVRLAEFRREAEMLRRVSSAHISRLYEFVETPEGAAIVMEAVRGVPLREVLLVDGRLAPESALAVLKGSLLGLADAHRAGVVHRDYKPGNVLVGPDRESKLVDFGIAMLAGEAGAPVGTPAYMAPEQWRGGPATPATDVYAATCVFFLGVTGARPYAAEDLQLLREAHEQAPIPVGQVPEPVRALVARGLAKTPEGRPAGAEEFVRELEIAAVAGYGADWEDRGLARLAQRAGVLLALSPLALLGVGTAAAPGVGAAAGAATAGTAGAGTAGAGTAGTAAGVAVGAKVGAIVAGVVAVAGIAAAVVVATDSGDSPPRAAAPASTVRPVTLAVNTATRTERDTYPDFDVSAQYVRVSGMSDPAAEKRVNDALMAPLDDWIAYVRAGTLGPEPGGGIPHVHNEVRIDRQDGKVLSVRYLLTVDSSQFGNHGAATIKTVNVDLANGGVVTAKDVFALRDQGDVTRLEQRIRAHAPNGYCEGTEPIEPERALRLEDLAPYTPGGSPVVQIEFTSEGVRFGIAASALGYPMACDYQELLVPYPEVADLLSPQGRTLLP